MSEFKLGYLLVFPPLYCQNKFVLSRLLLVDGYNFHFDFLLLVYHCAMFTCGDADYWSTCEQQAQKRDWKSVFVWCIGSSPWSVLGILIM